MQKTTFAKQLEIARDKPNELEKGKHFESMTMHYLQNEPLYKNEFKSVIRWEDWEGNQGKKVSGIDLIAVKTGGGGGRYPM